ncbi:MAG: ParA family protein [bacterium]
MGRVIAIANQKGGVGKTTTAISVASCLALSEQRTLLVDMDPQANATSGLGESNKSLGKSIYDVIINNTPLGDARTRTMLALLDLVPSRLSLVGCELELVSQPKRESKLKEAISKIKPEYRYLIIDCPPSLGLLTLNGLVAADSVLIPIQCEFYALEGLGKLLSTVRLVQRQLNPGLAIEGVLLTMFDSRTNLSKQVLSEVRGYFKGKVFETVIPRNVKLAEAPSFGKPIILYDALSVGAEAYLNLTKEVMKIG